MFIRVLELGAGTGTLGIFLAMHGAHVDLTDLPACCDLLQWNIDANRALALAEGDEIPLQIRAAPLDWTQPVPEGLRTECPYDLVVASDVIYAPRLQAPFFRTLCQLSSARTQVVLGYEAYVEQFEETDFYHMLRGTFSCASVPLPKEVSRGCDVYLLQRVEEDLSRRRTSENPS